MSNTETPAITAPQRPHWHPKTDSSLVDAHFSTSTECVIINHLPGGVEWNLTFLPLCKNRSPLRNPNLAFPTHFCYFLQHNLFAATCTGSSLESCTPIPWGTGILCITSKLGQLSGIWSWRAWVRIPLLWQILLKLPMRFNAFQIPHAQLLTHSKPAQFQRHYFVRKAA